MPIEDDELAEELLKLSFLSYASWGFLVLGAFLTVCGLLIGFLLESGWAVPVLFAAIGSIYTFIHLDQKVSKEVERLHWLVNSDK